MSLNLRVIETRCGRLCQSSQQIISQSRNAVISSIECKKSRYGYRLPAAMLQPLCVILCVLALAGCQSTPQGEVKARKAQRIDFSGSWEMDYDLNDSVDDKLDTYFYQLRRTMERQSNGRQMETNRMSPITQRTAQTVVAMAQFVEKISRVQVMDIEQTMTDIHVEREGTFALNCHFSSAGGLQQTGNPFATEVCGWDGHQLIFQLRLPEGLLVQQRLTMSASGEQINVATTMYSDRAQDPFTLNRSYSKFDKRRQGYKCEQTVEKGKVCTLSSQAPDERMVPQAPQPIIMNAE